MTKYPAIEELMLQVKINLNIPCKRIFTILKQMGKLSTNAKIPSSHKKPRTITKRSTTSSRSLNPILPDMNVCQQLSPLVQQVDPTSTAIHVYQPISPVHTNLNSVVDTSIYQHISAPVSSVNSHTVTVTHEPSATAYFGENMNRLFNSLCNNTISSTTINNQFTNSLPYASTNLPPCGHTDRQYMLQQNESNSVTGNNYIIEQ